MTFKVGDVVIAIGNYERNDLVGRVGSIVEIVDILNGNPYLVNFGEEFKNGHDGFNQGGYDNNHPGTCWYLPERCITARSNPIIFTPRSAK